MYCILIPILFLGISSTIANASASNSNSSAASAIQYNHSQGDFIKKVIEYLKNELNNAFPEKLSEMFSDLVRFNDEKVKSLVRENGYLEVIKKELEAGDVLSLSRLVDCDIAMVLGVVSTDDSFDCPLAWALRSWKSIQGSDSFKNKGSKLQAAVTELERLKFSERFNRIIQERKAMSQSLLALQEQLKKKGTETGKIIEGNTTISIPAEEKTQIIQQLEQHKKTIENWQHDLQILTQSYDSRVKMIKYYKDSKGECNGLSVLWAYGKKLEDEDLIKGHNASKNLKDDIHFFNKVYKLLMTWNEQREFTVEEKRDIERFLNNLHLYQQPSDVFKGADQLRWSTFFEATKTNSVSPNKQEIQGLVREFSLFLVFPSAELLASRLKKIIQPGALIMLDSLSDQGSHAMAVYQRVSDGKLYFYDPNAKEEEKELTDISELAKIYWDALDPGKMGTGLWDPIASKLRTVNINAYQLPGDPEHTYPKEEDLVFNEEDVLQSLKANSWLRSAFPRVRQEVFPLIRKVNSLRLFNILDRSDVDSTIRKLILSVLAHYPSPELANLVENNPDYMKIVEGLVNEKVLEEDAIEKIHKQAEKFRNPHADASNLAGTINARNINVPLYDGGPTPLFYGIEKGDSKLVAKILELGANISITRKNYEGKLLTPLDVSLDKIRSSAKSEDLEVFVLLVQKGALKDITLEEGKRCFKVVLDCHNVKVLEAVWPYLQKITHIEVNEYDYDKKANVTMQAPVIEYLMRSYDFGKLDQHTQNTIIKFLVGNKLDLTTTSFETLSECFYKPKDKSIFLYLLKNGLGVNDKEKALYNAIFSLHSLELVDYFIGLGANVNTNIQGKNTLLRSVLRSTYSLESDTPGFCALVVKRLIEKGTKVTIKDLKKVGEDYPILKGILFEAMEPSEAFAYALEERDLSLLERLLVAGINPNAKVKINEWNTEREYSPLNFVLYNYQDSDENQRKKAVELLIARGAKATKEDLPDDLPSEILDLLKHNMAQSHTP